MVSKMTKLTSIYQEDGVKDLPSASRADFARALKEERVTGETNERAISLLNSAIEKEAQANDS